MILFFIISVILFVLSVFLLRLLYGTGFYTSLWQPLLPSIFLGTIYGLFATLITTIFKTRRRYVVPFLLVILMISVFFVFKNPSRHHVFRKYITNPIPGSVSNLEVDLIYVAFDHKFVFKFSISQQDLQLFLKKKNFQLKGPVNYENGRLSWGGTLGKHFFNLYEHREKPAWFDLDTMDSPQIYHIELRSGHEQYLILSNTSSVIFLIDYEWK